MINSGVIADTCIWIEFFKTDSPLANELEALIKNQSLYMAGIVLAELLQGVRIEKQKATILESLSILPYLEMNKANWIKTGILSAQLRQKGITLPLSDLSIAVLAMDSNCQVFTTDPHFRQIPGLKLYK
jgi:hypothetical protein